MAVGRHVGMARQVRFLVVDDSEDMRDVMVLVVESRSRISGRAGVSVGSLRHFFPIQRQLFDTVVAGLHSLDVPDDPMKDAALSPSERLLGCLQVLLAAVGAGDHARDVLRPDSPANTTPSGLPSRPSSPVQEPLRQPPIGATDR